MIGVLKWDDITGKVKSTSAAVAIDYRHGHPRGTKCPNQGCVIGLQWSLQGHVFCDKFLGQVRDNCLVFFFNYILILSSK